MLRRRNRRLVTDGRRHLPLPTGQYAVGCNDIMTGLMKTGSFVRLYYPIARNDANREKQYYLWPLWLPHKKYIDGYGRVMNLWPPLFRTLFKAFIGDVYIPAVWKATPLRRQEPYPVIIFSHGLGGCRTTYSTICVELASQGYIVAAVEHRDNSACLTSYAKRGVLSRQRSRTSSSQGEMAAPIVSSSPRDEDPDVEMLNDEEEWDETDYLLDVRRLYSFCAEGPDVTMDWVTYLKVDSDKNEYEFRNRQVQQRVRECVRALDLIDALNLGFDFVNIVDPLFRASEFEGLMDMSKVAVAGHSFGGATTIMALATELRFRVGIALDSWMYPIRKEQDSFSLVTQPILFINTEKFQSHPNLRTMKLLEGGNPDTRIYTIGGTVHQNQSDIPFLFRMAMMKWIASASSTRDRFTAMDLTTRLMSTFLSHHFDLGINHTHHEYLSKHMKILKEGIRLKHQL